MDLYSKNNIAHSIATFVTTAFLSTATSHEWLSRKPSANNAPGKVDPMIYLLRLSLPARSLGIVCSQRTVVDRMSASHGSPCC